MTRPINGHGSLSVLHRQHLAQHLHDATPPHRTRPDDDTGTASPGVLQFALGSACGVVMTLAFVWAFHVLAGV
jgi:hypothetical protein